MAVKWRDVVGYEGSYRVSSDGRVKSVARKRRNRFGWMVVPGKELGWWMSGYKFVLLRDGRGGCKTIAAHRLVLEAFVGPSPEGMQCRHLDGDSQNNHLSNLEWGTPQSNMDDRERHGRHHRGSRCRRAKLTETDIPMIREMLALGYSMCSIGKWFGVTVGPIACIRNGTTWKHIP